MPRAPVDRSAPPRLVWVGRDRRETPAPTRLVFDAALAHRARVAGDNLVVQGENLAALAALTPRLAGRVKCVYLDPPYNTGGAFEHYDDARAHGAWLSLLRDRLELLHAMLRPDGLLFAQIDDREVAYLQTLLDERFGRERRVATIVVKMSELSGVKMTHAHRRLPKLKEYLLVYGRSPTAALRPLRQEKQGAKLDRYLGYYTRIIENPDEPPEAWRVVPLAAHLAAHGIAPSPTALRTLQLAERHRVVYRTNNALLAGLSFPTKIARVTSPGGVEYVWWEGKQMLFLADHCDEPLGDLWSDISTINLNKEGGVSFPKGKKPEALLARLLELATAPGDLVLDPFAGSGTTGAVALKLGRRFVLIESGAQAVTHVVPRLRRVVDGADAHGVTRATGWRGGSGFRFARLAAAKPRRGAGLAEVRRLSRRDPHAAEADENLLVHGDNLAALALLAPRLDGRVRCVYIDPPYNTGRAFSHYDDAQPVDAWSDELRPRLAALHDTLAPDGVLFASIDDAHLVRIVLLLDELFGAANSLGRLVWEKKRKASFRGGKLASVTEFVVAYAKDHAHAPTLIYGTTARGKPHPLNHAGNGVRTLSFPAGAVRFGCGDQSVAPGDMSTGNVIARLLDAVTIRRGTNVGPFRLEGEWRYSQARLDLALDGGDEVVIERLPFRPNHVKRGGAPRKMKNLLSVAHYDMATYEDAARESEALFGKGAAFDYPKPERLVATLLQSVTRPGDLVLDAYAGSGTTAAVAHKLGRRWVAIERGEQAVTHCAPRLARVTAGRDPGGVSDEAGWTGGGGFRFLRIRAS